MAEVVGIYAANVDGRDVIVVRHGGRRGAPKVVVYGQDGKKRADRDVRDAVRIIEQRREK